MTAYRDRVLKEWALRELPGLPGVLEDTQKLLALRRGLAKACGKRGVLGVAASCSPRLSVLAIENHLSYAACVLEDPAAPGPKPNAEWLQVLMEELAGVRVNKILARDREAQETRRAKARDHGTSS